MFISNLMFVTLNFMNEKVFECEIFRRFKHLNGKNPNAYTEIPITSFPNY